MKAYLISPEDQEIEDVDVSTTNDIKSLIGYDTLESDELDEQGNWLYFDEECFLRGASGRFQIDKLIPVSGKGIIAGAVTDGAVQNDVGIDIDELRSRIKYL